MNILHIVSFKTGASGPTSVLKPIIKILSAKGHRVYVMSSTGEYSVEVKNIVEKELGGFYKHYLEVNDNDGFYQDIDIAHIHGLFNLEHVKIGKVLQKYNIPYIISPHGGLMFEALKYHKFRKEVAVRFFLKNLLSKATFLHALGEEEKKVF